MSSPSGGQSEIQGQLAETKVQGLEEPPPRKGAADGENDEDNTATKEEKLPKLSAADFRVYNGLAERMDYFHNHFRRTWTMLYSACTNNKRPASMSVRQFVNAGLQFCSSLRAHHSIEESYFFPMLAVRMPEFKQGRNAAELLGQHKKIHEGMDLFEEYLQKCTNRETELDLGVLKTKMDSWGDVLWKHLDQEVRTLGAENMRKYWSIEDMKGMPV